MGLDDVLICAGEHSNMAEVYNALDIASSFGEGFPHVVGEAMACRVSCVVTDVEGSAMVVGHTGWVVSPNDSEALCLVWREIFLLEGMGFRAKAVVARDRFMLQLSINVRLKSTEQVLFGKVGCTELPGGAVKGSEVHRDGE